MAVLEMTLAGHSDPLLPILQVWEPHRALSSGGEGSVRDPEKSALHGIA